MPSETRSISTKLLALPETTASILYSFYEVLTGFQDWAPPTSRQRSVPATFDAKIVSPDATMFRGLNGIPIAPQEALNTNAVPDVIIVPDVGIRPDDDPRGRWPEATTWLKRMHDAGATVCSVCTGSLLLADAGLLQGRPASTHWAYADMFRHYYTEVDLQPEKLFVTGNADQTIITTGGSAIWEELALYLIAHYCGEAAAIQASKLYLLGDRGEGQLIYAALHRPRRHEDAIIADAQAWIADNYAMPNPVARLVARSGLAERTYKRRFAGATGYTPMDYIQTLRIEEAKQMLESSTDTVEEIGAAVGYEDPTFFRRLFKRSTGVTPSRYRQRFQRSAA